MRCRKNVKNMSDAEKRDFVTAMNGLRARDSLVAPGMQSRYDDWVHVHMLAMMHSPSWGHGDSVFFPWHRELLFRFEEELRTVVPGVTIPYWDWTRARATGDAGYPFTYDFIGVDGNDANGDLVERQPGAPTPYPYAFDPEHWDIVMTDSGMHDPPVHLIRRLGEASDAHQLPRNDSLVTGVSSTYRDAINSPDYVTLESRTEDIHNLVHRYVGGHMVEMASPNDPVFFLHHAAIDRMWSIWHQKYPALTPYVYTGSATGHHATDTLIYHEAGDPAPWSGTATPNSLVDSHAVHGVAIWYESDLPEITNETGPTLDFGAVPEGLTQYRAVHFRVRTCRPLHFRITGMPSAPFGLTVLGTDFPIAPDLAADFVDAFVWVQFTATPGLPPQTGGVDVEAYVVDDEGYYAATEGGEYVLGSWHVGLAASVEPRESNSVVLVLDRSYSMSSPAGGTSTRSGLLKSAVGVFDALLLPDDEIGIVSFDDVAETVLPIGPQSNGLGTTLTGTGLDPRGNTGIGLGIQAGMAMLGGATHPNRSLLVLTDGNENVHPYVGELPAGTITARTYAIGFGLPGDVSDPVLHQITNNTHGDLVVTGLLATDAERFQLTKYFVQVLAGVTRTNVVLDPQGELRPGEAHVIPFQVADTDVSIDVVFLAPIPGLLDVVLRTPGGDIVDADTPLTEPNVTYHVGPQVAFYRIALPALGTDPTGSHAGTWQIGLRLADRAVKQSARLESSQAWGGRGLPYSVVVHARSNLEFAARATQTSAEPGATVRVVANLAEYGVPFGGTATVWADRTAPDGTTSTLALAKVEAGRYEATFVAADAGIYRMRVRAEGSTSGGAAFTREKTLTAAVSVGGDSKQPPGGGDGTHEFLCHVVECLLSGKVLSKDLVARLRRAGVDLRALRACVEHACREASRTPRELNVDREAVAALAATALRERFADSQRAALAAPTKVVRIQPTEAERAKRAEEREAHRREMVEGGPLAVFPPVEPVKPAKRATAAKPAAKPAKGRARKS